MLGARVSVCRRAEAGREDGAVLLPSAPAVRQSFYVCFCWIRSASTPTCGSCRLLLVVRLCLDPLPRYGRFYLPARQFGDLFEFSNKA